MQIGHKLWVLPDHYMAKPFLPSSPSHESISVANFGDKTAALRVTCVFEGEDFAPVIIAGIKVAPMRSYRIRMDRLEEYGVSIPTDAPYSVLVESDEKVVVGYGRLNWIDGHMQSFGGVGYFED